MFIQMEILMAGSKNEVIQISGLKDKLSFIAMAILAVENFSDCWEESSTISYIPILINFIVFAVNAYEDKDIWISRISFIGFVIILMIVVADTKLSFNLALVEFFVIGLFALIVSGLYFWKLSRKSH